MSGEIIQSKLWKAYGKIGSKLGYRSTIYHPTSLNDPLNSQYKVGIYDVYLESDGDRKFKAYFDCAKNKRVISVGDYFTCNTGTYLIGQIDPIGDITVYHCNARIGVERVASDRSVSTIASQVPAHMTSPASGGNGILVPARNYSTEPVLSYQFKFGGPMGIVSTYDRITFVQSYLIDVVDTLNGFYEVNASENSADE